MNQNLSDYFDARRPITVCLSSGDELSGLPVVINNEFVILDCDDKRYCLPFSFIRYFFSAADSPQSSLSVSAPPGSRSSFPESRSFSYSGVPSVSLRPAPAASHIRPLRHTDAALKYFSVKNGLTDAVSDWLSAETDIETLVPAAPVFDYPPNRGVEYGKYHEDLKTWSKLKSRYLDSLKKSSINNFPRLAKEAEELAAGHPYSPEFYEQAAWMTYLGEEFGQAADGYGKAFRVTPDPEYMLFAARCARKAGLFPDASVYYAVYFSLNERFLSGGLLSEDGIRSTLFSDWASFLDGVRLSDQLPLMADFLTNFYKDAADKTVAFRLFRKTVCLFLLKCGLFDNAKVFLQHLGEISEKNVADGVVDSDVISGLLAVAFRGAGSKDGGPRFAFRDLLEKSREVPPEIPKEPLFSDAELPDDSASASLYVPTVSSAYSFGLIYRWIPHKGGYGFIFDAELFDPAIPFKDAARRGRYFSAEHVADPALRRILSDRFYSSYPLEKKDDLESYIPVFFVPSKTTADVSTQFVAHHVILAKSLDSRIRLALSFKKEGDIEFAKNVLMGVMAAVPDYGKLMPIYEKAPDYIFKDADVPALIAQWSEELLAESLHDVRRQGAVDPTEPATAEEWYRLGLSCLRRNTSHETDRAERCFKKAAEMKPGLSRHIFAEGFVRLARKDYAAAVSSFDRALRLNPDNYACHYLKGICRMKMRAFDDALLSFERSIDMRPDYLEAFLKKINVLYLKKRYEDVIAEATSTLSFFPENASLYSWRASALLRLKDFHRALADIEHALEIRPTDPECLFTQGYILAQMGRIREACLIWDDALRLNPNDVKTLSKKAFYLAASEDRIDEALELIEKALALGRDNPKTWYYRGCIYRYAGNIEEALASFDRSLEIDPSAERVARSRNAVSAGALPETPDDDGAELTDDVGPETYCLPGEADSDMLFRKTG